MKKQNEDDVDCPLLERFNNRAIRLLFAVSDDTMDGGWRIFTSRYKAEKFCEENPLELDPYAA